MSSNKKWFIGIGIGIILLLILSMIASWGGDPNFQYCHDRFYDQGFRDDDLVTLIESCLDNPGG